MNFDAKISAADLIRIMMNGYIFRESYSAILKFTSPQY